MTAPFTLDPIDEVPLTGTFLAKVLTQVRFSRTPALVTDEGEERLAALLHRYPVRRASQTLEVDLSAAPGAVEQKTKPVRIFADTSQQWQLTVTESAIALETTAYASRDDFCTRAHEIFDAVTEVSTPPVVDRVGLRYVDLFQEAALDNLHNYVVPPLRVLHGLIGDGLSLEYSVSDSVIVLGVDERLKVRSGLLPAGSGFDPTLPPLPRPSWIFDLDVFTLQAGFPFDVSVLDERLRRYASHVYSFFRWATTDALVEDFKIRPTKEDEEGVLR